MNNYGNNLVNRYQEHNSRPVNQNPHYQTIINNPQRMNMSRIENTTNQKKYTDDDLINYIIQPVKINKLQSEDVMKSREELKKKYGVDFDYIEQERQEYEQKFHNAVQAYKPNSEVVQQLWNNRTNIPYKNIIKGVDYTKQIRCADDLVVHKTTIEDKNIDKLNQEYNNLKQKIDKDNNDLKIFYSPGQENKHKRTFEYVNKYKYSKVKYDPTDHEGMKKFYQKELSIIDKSQHKIRELMESLTNGEVNNSDKAEVNKVINEIKLEKQKIKEYTEQIDNKNMEEFDMEVSQLKTLKIKKSAVSIIDTPVVKKPQIPDKYANR